MESRRLPLLQLYAHFLLSLDSPAEALEDITHYATSISSPSNPAQISAPSMNAPLPKPNPERNAYCIRTTTQPSTLHRSPPHLESTTQHPPHRTQFHPLPPLVLLTPTAPGMTSHSHLHTHSPTASAPWTHSSATPGSALDFDRFLLLRSVCFPTSRRRFARAVELVSGPGAWRTCWAWAWCPCLCPRFRLRVPARDRECCAASSDETAHAAAPPVRDRCRGPAADDRTFRA